MFQRHNIDLVRSNVKVKLTPLRHRRTNNIKLTISRNFTRGHLKLLHFEWYGRDHPSRQQHLPFLWIDWYSSWFSPSWSCSGPLWYFHCPSWSWVYLLQLVEVTIELLGNNIRVELLTSRDYQDSQQHLSWLGLSLRTLFGQLTDKHQLPYEGPLLGYMQPGSKYAQSSAF